jgi:hypothetical protein
MVVSVASAGAIDVSGTDDVASVALRDVEFCVLDLETTGGSSGSEAIAEIGAVKYRGGEEIGRFATLLNPLRAIPPSITVLTGITDSMVASAPSIGREFDSCRGRQVRGAGRLSHEQEVECDEYQCHAADDIDELAASRLLQLGVLRQHELEVEAVQSRDNRHDDKEPHGSSVVAVGIASRTERHKCHP